MQWHIHNETHTLKTYCMPSCKDTYIYCTQTHANGPLLIRKPGYWEKTQTHIVFCSFTRPQKEPHNLVQLCLQLWLRRGLIEWQRQQGPILTSYTKYYITAMLPHLATTQTFTYLYDNRRAQSSMWQQERDAAQYQAVPADKVIQDVICSEESNRERKEKRRGRYTSLYATQFGVGWIDNEAVNNEA